MLLWYMNPGCGCDQTVKCHIILTMSVWSFGCEALLVLSDGLYCVVCLSTVYRLFLSHV